MSSDAAKYPIVGIGASAGGIPALEGFFKGLEADCGAAFVVVTHLSPDRESLLHEVVARYTEMPVVVARDGARVESSTVYVLPQNAILSIEDGRLQIRRPNALSRERKPIDIFFSAPCQGPARIRRRDHPFRRGFRWNAGHQGDQGARRPDDGAGVGQRRTAHPRYAAKRHRERSRRPARAGGKDGRVKNMLTVVITIAHQTLRQAPDPEAFTEALIGRLNGMARAYALLSEESWTRLAVDDLVREQMEPFGLERISAEGADVSLKPEKGLALGMVLHELVTNAVKYGALASPEGHVAVKWSVSRDQRFQLEWLESGGPRISDPEEKGFGLKLLHGEVEYQLGGKVTTDFQPSGLTVKLEFPLA